MRRALILLVLALPRPADAEPPQISAKPQLSWRLDAPLVAAGLAGLGIASRFTTDEQAVPADGLPSSNLHLGFDREAIGEDSPAAGTASDQMEVASLAYPLLLRVAFDRGGERVRSPMRAALMTLESVAIGQGISAIIKPIASRPRPYAYMADSDRPAGVDYDVAVERAFHSFPSGHSTAAWAAVSTGICDHLLSRPTAGWAEHAAVGLVGGALATATAGLRVEAGQHFPSDVLVGSMIGITTGTAVPLVHDYVSGDHETPRPPRKSVLGALAGTAAGVGVGLFTAELLGD